MLQSIRIIITHTHNLNIWTLLCHHEASLQAQSDIKTEANAFLLNHLHHSFYKRVSLDLSCTDKLPHHAWILQLITLHDWLITQKASVCYLHCQVVAFYKPAVSAETKNKGFQHVHSGKRTREHTDTFIRAAGSSLSFFGLLLSETVSSGDTQLQYDSDGPHIKVSP